MPPIASVLTVLLLVTAPERVAVSRDTTYYVAPLRPDGTVDYPAALDAEFGAGVTPATNAAGPLLVLIDPRGAAAILGRLGVPPPGPEALRLSPFPREHVDELARAAAGPWSVAESPRVAQWLARNDAALDAVAEAVKRPRHFVPCDRQPFDDPDTAVPTLVGHRTAAQGLLARALARAARGEGAKARADVLAVLRLASLLHQGPSLIDVLAGSAIRGMASPLLIRIAPGDLPQRDARTFLDAVKTLPAGHGPADILDRLERVRLLDRIVRADSRAPAVAVEEALRLANRWYDLGYAFARAETAEARSELLAAQGREFAWLTEKGSRAEAPAKDLQRPDEEGRRARQAWARRLLASITLPPLLRTQVPFNEAQTQLRASLLVLSGRLQRARMGRLPERLDALAPGEPPNRDGYVLRLHLGPGAFAVTGVPEEQNLTGVRGFCADSAGGSSTTTDGKPLAVSGGRCPKE